MNILLGYKQQTTDSRNVDLSEAVLLSEEQKNNFIKLMESLFAVVEVKYRTEHRHERLGDRPFSRKWSNDEIKLLIKVDDDMLTTCRKLGRTYMSVEIRRGDYIPKITAFAERKGLNLLDDLDQLIELYQKEQLEIQQARRVVKRREKDELSRWNNTITRNSGMIVMLKLRLSILKDAEKKSQIEDKIWNFNQKSRSVK